MNSQVLGGIGHSRRPVSVDIALDFAVRQRSSEAIQAPFGNPRSLEPDRLQKLQMAQFLHRLVRIGRAAERNLNRSDITAVSVDKFE